MHIDDNVHILVVAVVDNFLDTSEVIIVDVKCCGVGSFVPCDRDTDAVEAVVMDLGYHLLSGLCVAP